MKVDIPADQAQTVKADSRGRVHIGKAYADQEVEVVVLTESDQDE